MSVRTCRISDKQLQLFARALRFYVDNAPVYSLNVPGTSTILNCTLGQEANLLAKVCMEISNSPEGITDVYGIAL
jgi:hypothetical protein